MIEDLPEQPEEVGGKPAALTLVLTVVAIVACAFIVWLIHPGANGAESGKLWTPDFDEPTPFEQAREGQAAALNTWTWADAQHTRVKLPVDVAIDHYLAGGRK